MLRPFAAHIFLRDAMYTGQYPACRLTIAKLICWRTCGVGETGPGFCTAAADGCVVAVDDGSLAVHATKPAALLSPNQPRNSRRVVLAPRDGAGTCLAIS